jgi:hypothetical protein
MENTDLLQIKIEKAKAQLSKDTLSAIAAVPWQAVILQMRETKGYSFEQLGDLETETELLLCGLLSADNYQREIQNRMGISKSQADDLVKEMNQKVFAKIREELIKITERKDSFKNETKETEKSEKIWSSAGIKIMPEAGAVDTDKKADLSIPELEAGHDSDNALNKSAPSILNHKMSVPFQSPTTKTEHGLDNLSSGASKKVETSDKPKIDPYREIPE